jgi:chaperonin GroES
MKAIPIGPRLLVEDIQATVDLVERGRQIGLEIIVNEQSVPKPTSGIVVAVGSDPILQEQVRVGDTVIFAKYAGSFIIFEGKQLRSLDFHEVITVLREDPI